MLNLLIQQIFGGRYVSTESPVDVSPVDNPTSEPEPDIVALKQPFTEFKTANPTPADIHLVVEIADSSLAFNLTTKAGLYARAAIVEYWVLDVAARRLIVHRDPIAGRYASIAAYSEDESVAPLGAPGSFIRIANCFAE